jgi:hypothetical protein
MKAKIGLLTVVALLVMVAMTGTVTAFGDSATNVVRFDPVDSSVPEYCQTVEVQVYADLVEDCAGGSLEITYNPACANVTDWALNMAVWPGGTWDSTVTGEEWITFGAMMPQTGTVLIGTLTIHCVCDASDCTTALTFGDRSALLPPPPDPGKLVVDFQPGSFTCGGPCEPPVVESVPGDLFYPGADVSIEGSGFAASTRYNVWIVPYTEDSHVAEGDSLAGLGGPGMVGTVTTEPDGSIPPTVIWQVPDDPALICTYYEIVVDDGDCVYNNCNDALDAVALNEWGFHIIPEAMTIILLSSGLVGLGGYYGLRRRKNSVSDN